MSWPSWQGGLPPRRPDQMMPVVQAPVISPGDPQVFRGRLVVIYGTTTDGSTGLFAYTGSPAADNLATSITNSDGTDPYGNAYLAGTVNYVNRGGQWQAIQVSDGALAFYLGPVGGGEAGPWTSTSFLDIDLTGGGALVAGTPVVAVEPGTTATPETWHDATLGTGWSQRSGYATAGYRLTAQGDVELVGEVVGASVTAGSTIMTLPAGWYGTVTYTAIPATVSGATAGSGQTIRITLNSSGEVQMFGNSGTISPTISLDGLLFPISRG